MFLGSKITVEGVHAVKIQCTDRNTAGEVASQLKNDVDIQTIADINAVGADVIIHGPTWQQIFTALATLDK